MTKRQPPPVDVPESVTNETIDVPRGETRYWLLLADEDVELLARGVVSEETSQRAFQMLDWKRLNARALAYALDEQRSEVA